MSAICSFKTLLFYVVTALALLAEAASAAPTTLPIAESASGQMTTEAATTADSITTTDGEAQTTDNSSSFSVPAFQCAANTGNVEHARSVSALYNGLIYVSSFVTEPTAKACPEGYDRSIRERIHLNPNSDSLHEATSILQAYSGIALLASQTEAVSEDDRRKMLTMHELLNGLIRNYFEVISPSHCSCPGSNKSNCINELRDLTQVLNLRSYPDNCSPADYVSDTLPRDLRWMNEQFQRLPEFRRVYESANFVLISCQKWKGRYIPTDSPAHSQFTCP